MLLHSPTFRAPLPAPPLPGTGSRWAIMLDIDGTLLDFAHDPRVALVEPDVRDLMHELHRVLDGALALVSDRSLDEIDRLFRRMPPAVAGSHGLDLRHADGSFRRKHPGSASQSVMHTLVCELACRFDGVVMQDRQRTITLHLPSDTFRRETLRVEALALLAQLPGYELQPGRDSLEFKPRGMSKAYAVREFIRHPVFAGRTAVYLGDDLADEHAFKTANLALGHSVLIGSREGTCARYGLPDPAAVRAWLGQVLHTLSSQACAPRLMPRPAEKPPN